MLHDATIAFLIRCGVWALIAWTIWSQPLVQQKATAYRTAWIQAWRVEASDCDVQAYGLLFRRSCEE
jgi:hypothetical protein